jgi:hypothetical protein
MGYLLSQVGIRPVWVVSGLSRLPLDFHLGNLLCSAEGPESAKSSRSTYQTKSRLTGHAISTAAVARCFPLWQEPKLALRAVARLLVQRDTVARFLNELATTPFSTCTLWGHKLENGSRSTPVSPASV